VEHELTVFRNKLKSNIRDIRNAVQSRRISFPARVPVFIQLHRPDMQWRVVILYYVRGWSSQRIAIRYGISDVRVRQVVRQWTVLAILRGYMDLAPSEREYACFSWLLSPT